MVEHDIIHLGTNSYTYEYLQIAPRSIIQTNV